MPRKSDAEIVDITVTKHAETSLAVLVSDNGQKKNAVWLPFSQIEICPSRKMPGHFEVTMPTWLAQTKGLI